MGEVGGKRKEMLGESFDLLVVLKDILTRGGRGGRERGRRRGGGKQMAIDWTPSPLCNHFSLHFVTRFSDTKKLRITRHHPCS